VGLRKISGVKLLVALIGLVLVAGCAHRRAFDFALIGDVPYTDEAATNAFPNMIEEINAADLAFVIHDGDIKHGDSPCTDQVFRERLAQFETFEHPLFYIFGDNEWQDCGSNKTNKFDPMERLGKLREMFCQGESSLGRHKMALTRQNAAYPENIRWQYGDVMFGGFNIPGPANDYGKPEFAARNAANSAWLRESFAVAKKENVRGIMLVIQANPHFELGTTNQVRRGFNEWLKVLEEQTVAFRRPVVLVHGDTHYFRIDKPLVSNKTKGRVQHFTRLETFGHPDVHWVRARVDPQDANLFSFRVELVKRNLNEAEK